MQIRSASYWNPMASTLTQLLVHVTFSTKDRAALIPPAIETDLYAFVGGICRRLHSPLLAMNGTSDHVHMLVSLGKATALSELMLNVKRDSSKWMKEQNPSVPEFAWQDGYFAFSIGMSGVEALKSYIAGQKEHHRTVDFKREVLEFLRKYRVEWDEAHIWT